MGKEARNFSTSKSYAVGDICLYFGVLYRFIVSHSAGAWNEAHVQKVDTNTGQMITRIIAEYENAWKVLAFANSVVFEPSQISGTRYKYVFTDAPDPR